MSHPKQKGPYKYDSTAQEGAKAVLGSPDPLNNTRRAQLPALIHTISIFRLLLPIPLASQSGTSQLSLCLFGARSRHPRLPAGYLVRRGRGALQQLGGGNALCTRGCGLGWEGGNSAADSVAIKPKECHAVHIRHLRALLSSVTVGHLQR